MRTIKCNVIFLLVCPAIYVLSIFYLLQYCGVKPKDHQAVPSYGRSQFTSGLVGTKEMNISSKSEKKGPLKNEEDEHFDLGHTNDAACPLNGTFGQKGDGPYKWIELKYDGQYSMCLSPPYNLKKKDCITMNFGINNEWDFEDDIAKKFECKIYAFDPSMKVNYTRRGEHIRFYKIGLDGHNYINRKKWKLVTLQSAMELVGVTSDAVIDLLKIDIEGSEWLALETALRDGSLKHVKQLIFESHVLFEGFEKMDPLSINARTNIFRLLRSAGFYQWKCRDNVTFRKRPSPHTRKIRNCCAEHHFINKNFN